MTKVVGGLDFLGPNLALKPLLLFLFTLYFRQFHFLPQSLDAHPQPGVQLVQFGDTLMMSNLLAAHILERPLKLDTYRSLGLIAPKTAPQHDLTLDVFQTPLNILLACVEL